MRLPTWMYAARDFWCGRDYYLEKFILRDGKKHPFAIICPGGGYSMVCSFVEGVPYARKLNQMGYSAIVLHYRCGRKATYPNPQDDLARAVKETFAHAEEWDLDTNGYSVWGSSAGGHLAAAFGTDAMGYRKYGLPKPSALILSYPVITMGDKTHEGSRRNLLGNHASSACTIQTSVEKQVTQNYPPTFIWYGRADRTVDPENSEMMASALAANSVPYCLLSFPGVDHGVGLGEGLPCRGWFVEALNFWEIYRKGMQSYESN